MQNGRGRARRRGSDNTHGVVVLIIYGARANYSCPFCGRSTLVAATQQYGKFVCIGCDEHVREQE